MKYAALIIALVLLIIGGGYYVAHRGAFSGPTERMTEVVLAADAYPLYPGLAWGTPHAAQMENLSGFAVESAPLTDISDLSASSQPFEQYWKEKLESEGYSIDTALAAGGPGADVTAYKKGSNYIVVSYHTAFKGTPPGAPVQCPCDITFSVFSTAPATSTGASPKNAAYSIDGESYLLTNGSAEGSAAPGSASSVEIRYFGNETEGDLNGDGVPDAAFILTESGGGSGTFYYAVAALKTPAGYQGTNAVLLGDRIAPQTTQIQNGAIIVNYADRKPGDPMTTKPSVGVSKYLKVEDGQLIEVQQ